MNLKWVEEQNMKELDKDEEYNQPESEEEEYHEKSRIIKNKRKNSSGFFAKNFKGKKKRQKIRN